MQGYELGEKIGKGAMGDVYEGRHVGLNRAVAIKVLKASLADDEEFVKRFLEEARLCALFDHPHIVRVYDVGRNANGTPCLVMERLHGETLKERLERGPLSEDDAVAISHAILRALECAHAQNIVHRDMKPGNVFLSNQGVKVMDFGIAKALNQSGLTSTGVLMGTPAYMSPEQAEGRPVDPRTDLYGVGIMLYEMLTGDVPFKADTQLSVLHMQVNAPPPPLPNTVSPWLRAVVARTLAKNSQERFASTAEMRQALERGPQGFVPQKSPLLPRKSDTKASDTGSVSLRQSPPIAWAKWVLGGVVAFLLLGMITVFLQMQKENSDTQKRADEARKQVVNAQMQADAAQKQAEADRKAREAAEAKVSTLQQVIASASSTASETNPSETTASGNESAEDSMTATDLVVKAYYSLCRNLLASSQRQARKAIAKNSSSANAHAILANALLEEYELTQGDDALRTGREEAAQARDLDSDCAMALNALAFVRWIDKDNTEATTLVHKASQLGPKLAYIYNMQGCIDAKTEDQIEDFKQAIEVDPNISWAHTNLAWIYLGQDKIDDLKKEIKEEKRLSEISYWVTLGEMAIKFKRWKEAEQFCRKAIELNTDYCAGYAPLATALLAQGDKAGALEQAKLAREKGIVHHAVFKELGME